MRGLCIPFIESFKGWSAFASNTQNKQHDPNVVDLSAPTYLVSIRLLNFAWTFFNWYYNCSYIFFPLLFFNIHCSKRTKLLFLFTWSVLPDFSLPSFFLFWSPEVSIRNVSFIFLRAGSYPSMKNGREVYYRSNWWLEISMACMKDKRI